MRKPGKNADQAFRKSLSKKERKSDSPIQNREKLIQELSELEERLASLEANIPAHSMSVSLMAEMEDTEEKIKQKKEILKKMRK
jgi:hypothetical protein